MLRDKLQHKALVYCGWLTTITTPCLQALHNHRPFQDHCLVVVVRGFNLVLSPFTTGFGLTKNLSDWCNSVLIWKKEGLFVCLFVYFTPSWCLSPILRFLQLDGYKMRHFWLVLKLRPVNFGWLSSSTWVSPSGNALEQEHEHKLSLSRLVRRWYIAEVAWSIKEGKWNRYLPVPHFFFRTNTPWVCQTTWRDVFLEWLYIGVSEKSNHGNRHMTTSPSSRISASLLWIYPFTAAWCKLAK